ncbi:MAG: chloride channel protein [Eubacterium sp.]
MTMFSGGNAIQAIQYEYLQYTPYLLILIGVVKLFLTNVCIESGWRGGHFFPVIFSGLSIGFGFSVLLNTNQIFSVILVTAALLGTILQQPLGAIVLSIIFFPIEDFGWMCLASVVGGCIPLPKQLRMNPENKGFIYNMVHFKGQKRLPMKES